MKCSEVVKRSLEGKKEIGKHLGLCLLSAETYGKKPEDFKAICEIFIQALSDLQVMDVIPAFAEWIKTQERFPTPAGIRKIALNFYRERTDTLPDIARMTPEEVTKFHTEV